MFIIIDRPFYKFHNKKSIKTEFVCKDYETLKLEIFYIFHRIAYFEVKKT